MSLLNRDLFRIVFVLFIACLLAVTFSDNGECRRRKGKKDKRVKLKAPDQRNAHPEELKHPLMKYPEFLEFYEPMYPEFMESKCADGTSWILAHIDPQGNVQNVILDTSSGYNELDIIAVNTAYECKLKKFNLDGEDVFYWVRWSYSFNHQADNCLGDSIWEDQQDYPMGLIEYPKIKKRFVPSYPGEPLYRGLTGEVKIAHLLDEKGNVIDVRIMETSKFTAIDQAAVEAAYKQKFTPARFDDRCIKVWVLIPYQFILN